MVGVSLHDSEYCYEAPVYDHSNTNYFDISSLELHNIAWIVTGICVCLACILSFYLIIQHLLNYTKPQYQKHIVRILLLVPIYAIDSFLSFRFYWIAVYFDVVRDCYEAFVIYTFYSLLIEYVGGYEHGKQVFEDKLKKTGPQNMVIPLCCFKLKPTRGFIRTCKRLTLQYVVIRPVMTIVIIILQSVSQYCNGNYSPLHGYVWITIVNFISVTVAMYALVLFYSVARDEIAKYKPIPKFASVKFVIMLCFWQSILVAGFVDLHGISATTYWSTDNIATGVQNALLCVEMLIAAIFHIFAFDYKEFVEEKRTNIFKAAANVFSPHDIAIDVYRSFFPQSLRWSQERMMRVILKDDKTDSDKSDNEKRNDNDTSLSVEEDGADVTARQDKEFQEVELNVNLHSSEGQLIINIPPV